jgi:anti-sigma B factor antagonist
MATPVDVVRELWEAYAARGIDAVLELADDGVVWQPYVTEGRILRGTAELREALEALADQGVSYDAELDELEEHDGVVLASGSLRVDRNGAIQESTVYWAYHFRAGRLWRQSTHGSRQEALDALVALRAAAVPLEVTEDASDGDHVVHVDGELDIASAPDLEAVLLRRRPARQRVILDLRSLRFIDSTGLRALLRGQVAAKEGGWQLFLRDIPPNVRRLFSISGVQEAIPPELPSQLGD